MNNPFRVKLVRYKKDNCVKYTKKICPGDIVTVKTNKSSTKVEWEIYSYKANGHYKIQSAPLSGSIFKLGDTPVINAIVDAEGEIDIFLFTIRVIKNLEI